MPRKLGQHFLHYEPILTQIAAAACHGHCSRVIEIGPGRGALTQHLLPLTDELHAVEIDARLMGYLQRKFAGETKLTLHRADVLDIDLQQWGPASIAGNLPYYITSPILDKFLAMDGTFTQAVFLMQLEVADRLLAAPSTSNFGYLTFKTQLLCSVELICRVEPKFFDPPPQVDSAAVRLVRKANPPADLPELLTFASRCFAHKRKTIRNNLRPFYGANLDGQPESLLRAEQLGVEGLTAFYRRLTAMPVK